MFPALLICAFMVKNAATQNVSTSLEITKSCVLIGDDVKLLCTVSSGCCSSQFRVWQKVGVVASLLNDGVSLNDSKYVEDYDNGTTGYNLIIKNLQKSDLGANYKCVYGLKSSELFLDGILCTSSEVNESGDCWKCAGTDYGWSVIGTAIGTVIIIIAKLIIMIIAKDKKVELGTVLIVGELTFIISAVVNISFALPIGYLVCHCVNGKDPLLILLGLGTSVITGVIIIITIKLKQVGKLKTVLIVGGVIVIISGVLNLFALLNGYYTCHCVGGCWKCAGEGYGLSILGTVIGTVIIIIAKVKICATMCAWRDGLLFIIGVVFSAIVALPIGYCMCQCVDETNLWLILLGLFTSLIIGVISIAYKQIKGDDLDFRVECYLQALAALCTGCLEILISLCTGKKSKQDGDQNEKDETD